MASQRPPGSPPLPAAGNVNWEDSLPKRECPECILWHATLNVVADMR